MTTIQQFDHQISQLLENRRIEGVELLYQRYGPALYGIIRRQVDSVDQAQGILNEAFVLLWKYANLLDLEASPLFSQLYLLVQEQIKQKAGAGRAASQPDLGQQVLDLVILGKCHPTDLQSILPLSSREIEASLNSGLQKLYQQLSV
jgi:DNA-directed RNA polymerase specialized sigma24 family protein